MKRMYSVLMILLLSGSALLPVLGQEDSKNEKQKEEELLRAISEQKKALNEQKKAQELQNEELQKSLKELESLRDMDFDIDFDMGAPDNNVRVYKRGRVYSSPEVYGIPAPPDAPMVHVYGYGTGSGERTSWEFSRSVRESSFKKEYSFDVEKSTKSVTMAISGDCKVGEITIRIIAPNGKTFSDAVIDEFGNLNVRKSFTISETENQDKTGEWKFQVNSEKATGYFKISFNTF